MNIKSVFVAIVATLSLTACGSRPSDFKTNVEVKNPLPPCPDSPNCVRITKKYSMDKDDAWKQTISVLQAMKPYDIDLTPDEYRLDAVFLVVFFQDDMNIKLETADSTSTYVHIRSSSRVGYTDFGVNRQRVQEFLNRFEKRVKKN